MPDKLFIISIMEIVNFKFTDGEFVKDPFGVKCLIKEASYSNGRITYWVVYKDPDKKSAWWLEGNLVLWE